MSQDLYTDYVYVHIVLTNLCIISMFILITRVIEAVCLARKTFLSHSVVLAVVLVKVTEPNSAAATADADADAATAVARRKCWWHFASAKA